MQALSCWAGDERKAEELLIACRILKTFSSNHGHRYAVNESDPVTGYYMPRYCGESDLGGEEDTPASIKAAAIARHEVANQDILDEKVRNGVLYLVFTPFRLAASEAVEHAAVPCIGRQSLCRSLLWS